MTTYHLAIDIGASSGRMILGSLQNNRLTLEEIHRFENSPVIRNGSLCWQTNFIFSEILTGLKKCTAAQKIPQTLGIDTWGVDFALVDYDGRLIGDTVAYRDQRTQNMDEEISKLISPEEIYLRTGIQKQPFNSIYQLYSIKLNHPEQLAIAHSFLMIPEYMNYLLTGVRQNEYTNATTTGLVNVNTRNWDWELINQLGLKASLFGDLGLPGTSVGELKPEIVHQVGFHCNVVLPPTHDTASAVLATPLDADDELFLSSGTWSLMGTELTQPNCSEGSRLANFSNEGGIEFRYRFLRNIMGLWMIQSLKRELGENVSFPEIKHLALAAHGFPSVVDVNHNEFLAPASMIQAVKDQCARTQQPVPVTSGEIAECIYQSLAQSYAHTALQIEQLSGRQYSTIHIAGGGSQDEYLNRLTHQATGKKVLSGPIEATAIGNLLAQMIQAGKIASVIEARKLVARSFDIQQI
jgi:rhamnulokinase